MKYSSIFKLRRRKIASNSQSQNSTHDRSQDQFEDFLSDLASLRPDLSDAYIKSLLLDEKQYLSFYQDIRNSGLSGTYHYYTYGYKEGREFFEPNLRAIPTVPRLESGKTIIFFDTVKTNASFLYRGYFPEIRNKSAVIIHQATSLKEALFAIFNANEMIFIRPSNGSIRTRFFMKLCQNLNIKITIDVDDLLLPDYSQFKGAVRSGILKYDQIHNHLTKDSSILLGAEKMVCSTQTIATIHSNLVDEIVVSKNRLPLEYFIPKDEVIRKKIENKIKILYLSGSQTHLKDYSTISGPLLKLAQDFPDKFTISFLGMVSDQTSIFSHLGVKCHFLPSVNFEEMLTEIKKHDLVLVPLETTVFNDAKSNIKFIEAASQGVAVIASPVAEYVNCIKHNINGWLCSEDNDWYLTLSYLFNHPENIISASINAYDSAAAGYSV